MPNGTAADVMEKNVVTLSPEADVYSALRTLLKKKISGAPVVDQNGNVVGMLSEKDCLKILAGAAFDGLPGGTVAHYMTHPVVSITPTTSIFDVVNRFLHSHFRRLPVVDDDGRLMGQVSRRNVLVAIESIRENSYLYGSPDKRLSLKEEMGVDSAMRRARDR